MKRILSLVAFFLVLNCQVFAKRRHKPKNINLVSQPTILVSVPKCGTHLLVKLIALLNNKTGTRAPTITALYQKEMQTSLKPGFFYVAHAPCSRNNLLMAHKTKAKIILCLRDPRDVFISYAHYLKREFNDKTNKKQKLTFNNGLQGGWEFADLPIDNMITEFIKEFPLKGPEISKYTTIVEFYAQFLAWPENYSNILVTSFEKLIGSKGGGDSEMQIKEIKRIAAFLEVQLTPTQINAICENLFGGTNTFRKGSIGSWKEQLTDKQKNALKDMPGFNELLIALNYENDEKW